MRITLCLAPVACALVVCSCSTASPAPPYQATFAPVDSDGHVLRDARGRTVILRGFNVKADPIFDVTFDDGTPPRETIPPLDASDLALIRQNGFNVLRLPVNWSAFEPQQGQYQTAYLDRIAQFLDVVRPFGIYVLLDFHEDGWSKWICEDGAPQWAEPALSGPPSGGTIAGDCHVSNDALNAHAAFFADTNGLQEAYAAMYVQFATRFAQDESVIGYEIMNEPIAADSDVQAFSVKLAQAIRAVDAKHLIVWEPSAFRNIFDNSPLGSAPFPVPGAVYAVHIYTQRVGDWTTRVDNSVDGARAEADSWGLPLMVTEYGCDSGPGDPPGASDEVDRLLDGFDRDLASSTEWIWDPGVVTRNPDGSFAYVASTQGDLCLPHLARPYAPAVGGDVAQITWDGTALTVAFHGHPGVPTEHDVFWNLGTPQVTCDGANVPPPAPDDRSIFTLECGRDTGDHLLVFTKAQ
jgi:endoglycosylceramidase